MWPAQHATTAPYALRRLLKHAAIQLAVHVKWVVRYKVHPAAAACADHGVATFACRPRQRPSFKTKRWVVGLAVTPCEALCCCRHCKHQWQEKWFAAA